MSILLIYDHHQQTWQRVQEEREHMRLPAQREPRLLLFDLINCIQIRRAVTVSIPILRSSQPKLTRDNQIDRGLICKFIR